LRRTLQRRVESPLSKKLLANEFSASDVVIVNLNDEKEMVFRKKDDDAIEMPLVMDAAGEGATLG